MPDGTVGSPTAPSRIASWSRSSRSTESGSSSPVRCQRAAPRSYSVVCDAGNDAAQDFQALGNDLGTDAVTGDDRELHR